MISPIIIIEIGIFATIVLVEISRLSKRMDEIETRLINMRNRVRGLPPLTTEEKFILTNILTELNNGDGYLDLAGHIRGDKERIELLKRVIATFISRSSAKHGGVNTDWVDYTELNQRKTTRDKIIENAKFILLAQDFSRIMDELLGEDYDSDLDMNQITDIMIEKIQKLKED